MSDRFLSESLEKKVIAMSKIKCKICLQLDDIKIKVLMFHMKHSEVVWGRYSRFSTKKAA